MPLKRTLHSILIIIKLDLLSQRPIQHQLLGIYREVLLRNGSPDRYILHTRNDIPIGVGAQDARSGRTVADLETRNNQKKHRGKGRRTNLATIGGNDIPEEFDVDFDSGCNVERLPLEKLSSRLFRPLEGLGQIDVILLLPSLVSKNEVLLRCKLTLR